MDDKTGRRRIRRFPEKKGKAAMNFNPEAAAFTPRVSTADPSPAQTKEKKTKTSPTEEDIGCFLCDDGWWCPYCSKSDAYPARASTTMTASDVTEKRTGDKPIKKLDSRQLPGHTSPTRRSIPSKLTAAALAIDSDSLPPRQYGLSTWTLPFGLTPEDLFDDDILPPRKRGEVSLFPLAPGYEREMAMKEGKSWGSNVSTLAPAGDGEARTEKKTGNNWPAVERRIKKWRADVEAAGRGQDEVLARFLDRSRT